MKFSFLFIIFFLINTIFIFAEDTSKSLTKVLVYSFSEVRNDDILQRTVYLEFKVFKQDTLIISVGELFDKPAEISLPKGKYKFSFNTSKGWIDCNVVVDNSNSIIRAEEIIPERKDKSKR
ncbi:MAG: hypothetical protein N2560_05840 [Ignavibacteria bacterium]|nr:hypothetical protein [Ignavibacteria bacterium]